MAKIGRPIKFVIRLTPEERTRLDGPTGSKLHIWAL